MFRFVPLLVLVTGILIYVWRSRKAHRKFD